MASSRGGKKMWCVPTISDEFVDRMEDVLRLYARKLDRLEPVVCFDERPVVLHEDAKPGVPMRPGAGAQRLRVRPLRHGQHLLHRRAADWKPADVRHGRSQATGLCACPANDRAALSARAADSPRTRQLEHSLSRVARAGLGRARGPTA